MTTARGFVGRSAPYLHCDELADLLNAAAGKNVWDARRVRRLLQRHDAATRLGGRWVTTKAKLRQAFPDVWQEILLRLADDHDGAAP